MGNEVAPGEPRSEVAWTALVAFALTVAGGLVAAIAEFVDLPVPLVLSAVIAFFAGTILAVVDAYRRSRVDGVGFWRALGRSLKMGARWIWEMAP